MTFVCIGLRVNSTLVRRFGPDATFDRLRNIYYGYLWWGIDYPYKDRTVHAFFAGGAGGQTVMMIPELDLVIAAYAGNYSSAGTKHISQELIPRYILPPVREPGDDRNAPVISREDYVTAYGPRARESKGGS